jgi:predicted RNA-binding Zn ribbon-like protein
MREWSDKAFVGDNIVLDFLNTGGGDTKARDFERLETFSDVARWAHAGRVVDDSELAALADMAQHRPMIAEACRSALTLHRETLYRFLTGPMNGAPLSETDRLAIEQGIHAAFTCARLVPRAPGPATWLVGIGDAGLSLVKFRLDLAASALLTDAASQAIRQCEMCSWLFLDPSVTKRRRWCSMAACGNRAKAQRHYHRSRAVPQ